MIRKYLQKKIWVNPNRYVYVRVYKEQLDMQKAYKRLRPLDENHFEVRGVHIALCRYKVKKDKSESWHAQSGIVMLHFEDCGAGIATHELMHAVLYGYNHSKQKRQYPITIRSMYQEEVILHNYTYTVQDFYNWYWDVIEPTFKKKKK